MPRNRVATLVTVGGLLAGTVTWLLVTYAWAAECAPYADTAMSGEPVAQQSVCEAFGSSSGAVFFALGALTAMAAVVVVATRWREGRTSTGWLVSVAILPVLLPTMQLVGLIRPPDDRPFGTPPDTSSYRPLATGVSDASAAASASSRATASK